MIWYQGICQQTSLFHYKLSHEKNPKLPAKNIEKDEAGHTTACQVTIWKKTNKRDTSTASRARFMIRFRVDYYYSRVVHCAQANHRDTSGTLRWRLEVNLQMVKIEIFPSAENNKWTSLCHIMICIMSLMKTPLPLHRFVLYLTRKPHLSPKLHSHTRTHIHTHTQCQCFLCLCSAEHWHPFSLDRIDNTP